MFFDHHNERMSLQLWSVLVFNFSSCHLSLSVRLFYKRENMFIILPSFSLCCTWYALSIITWCSRNCCLFPLCIHGVSQNENLERNPSFVSISLIAGFYAGRLYKTIKGSYWKRTAALVSSYSENQQFIELIFSDSNTLPIGGLWLWSSSELFHLRQTFIRCCAISNNGHYPSHVVGNLISTCLPWFLFRLSQICKKIDRKEREQQLKNFF